MSHRAAYPAPPEELRAGFKLMLHPGLSEDEGLPLPHKLYSAYTQPLDDWFRTVSRSLVGDERFWHLYRLLLFVFILVQPDVDSIMVPVGEFGNITWKEYLEARVMQWCDRGEHEIHRLVLRHSGPAPVVDRAAQHAAEHEP